MSRVSSQPWWLLRVAFSVTFLAVAALGADAATASWDRNTEPDIAGYRLSYGTQPGVHAVTVDVGNVITCQFNPPPGLRYYVVVQAYNTSGEISEESAEVIIDIPLLTAPPTSQLATTPASPAAAGQATATYSGSDTTTQGNWRGVYGGDGYMLAPSNLALPSYEQVAVGAVAYTWDGNSVDPRVLQLPTGASRIAATWYAADAFAFNIAISDGKAHAVSLYGLDFDRLGRAEAIEVLDATTLQLLDRRDANAMSGGVYFTWQISGNVIIRITRLAGPNAVVAGVFFGSPVATSADGTLVPPAAQLVDASGALWTLATDRGVLRNGLQAGGGYGTKLLWSGGTVYTFGLDSNWWKWTGSGWNNAGPVQPGGSVTPPPAPPPTTPPVSTPSATSAAGTLVPPAGQIVDAAGVVWTLATDHSVLRNGALAAGGYGTKLLWSGSILYTFGLNNTWWQWTGSGWSNVGTTPPSTEASAIGTVVPPAAQVIDSSGAVWTIDASQRILRNGAQAGGGSGSKILWMSGTIYVLGGDGWTWWKWTGSGWISVGGVQPG